MNLDRSRVGSHSSFAPWTLGVVALAATGVAFSPFGAEAHGRGHLAGPVSRASHSKPPRLGSRGDDRACYSTAQIAFVACGHDVKDNELIAQAKCLNISDDNDHASCLQDAQATRKDEQQTCQDVRAARTDVCSALTVGSGPYDPVLDPSKFVSADAIDGNDYFPLKPGTTWVYQNTDGETITDTVTDQTSEFAGIPVRMVTDVVVDENGKTSENTQDWYAEDVDNNVWYFGENTAASDPDSILVSVDGSWETGIDGARPGILMPATFDVGNVYRQEFLLGDAEDIAENLSTTETVSVPQSGAVVASCNGDCLKTHEYSPLEPDSSESKFYAKGVGVILTLDDNDATFREELVAFTPAR